VLLVVMGPLVGVSFMSAIRTYTEVSGLSGTAADANEVLSPLIGVWAPTFSACELAAVFLLPFLAIHLVAGDRQSGALKLELQQPISPFFRIAAKTLVALAGWMIAMLPPLSAVLLWRIYGGSVYAPEMVALIAGHVLNAGLTIALGAATASLTENPSTAAILTLAVTVSTWILNFFGAIQGGWWERGAGYTPAALVAEFQHGLVRLDTTLVALTLILTGLSLAAIWMRLGVAVKRRVYESVIAVVLLAAAIVGCARIPASQTWDWSESRGNSFSEADELALKQIHSQLRIDVHLAPEDPRRLELEHRALSKLRRVMPNLQVSHESSTASGLFEETSAGYGEIRYYLGSRSTMSRVITAEGVLETIYSLAGIAPPKEDEEAIFRGHPLTMPTGPANAIFYGVWPGLFLTLGILLRKRLN
jgi:ABC-2 type transport system permease protein